MAGTEMALHVWKEWGLQMLILLSFAIQVVLLILADLRRSMDSGVLRACVWSAYLLADSTAIYVLGHLSVIIRSPEHELMAFWAPFLLLHLGGQDNITAYAIEDNRLWLRHLQTLAVQVFAAAYVLYESPILGGRSLLRPASILMFGVGVVKYGERVWALKRAGKSPGGNNYRSTERAEVLYRLPVREELERIAGVLDTETFLLIAHDLLEVPKDLLLEGAPHTEGLETDLSEEDDLYKVVEMQLSLMHDIFYTKVGVMHGWYVLCIRIVCLVVTTIALVLFHFLADQKVVYSTLDVVVTYVLLIGAVVLEITSVFRAMFSSWTCALLTRLRWYFPVRVVLFVRRLVHAAWKERYWSGSMGQHNMIQLCGRSRASRCSKIARWMGAEDPWNMMVYSRSIPVSDFIKQLMVKQLLKDVHWSAEHIIAAKGRKVLKTLELHEELNWSVEESILVWHIATDIYLYWYKEQQQKAPACGLDDAQSRRRAADLAKAAEALSNYMLFLLASRPYMLPPPNDRTTYVQMCYALLEERRGPVKSPLTSLEYSSAEDLAKSLQRLGNEFNNRTFGLESKTPIIGRSDSIMPITGAQLGEKLISEDLVASSSTSDDTLDLIVEVWLEMLFYVGYRCSAHSHSKQLSNGGELVTIAALLAKYIRATPSKSHGFSENQSQHSQDPVDDCQDPSEYSEDASEISEDPSEYSENASEVSQDQSKYPQDSSEHSVKSSPETNYCPHICIRFC